MLLISSQVDQLGIVEAESDGQPYYLVYLFGPYKLLTVIAGCTIAFFWTVFPYPVTSRSQVRKLLGRALFVLANFYSCMHTTIEVWIEGTQSPPSLQNQKDAVLGRNDTHYSHANVQPIHGLRASSRWQVS